MKTFAPAVIGLSLMIGSVMAAQAPATTSAPATTGTTAKTTKMKKHKKHAAKSMNTTTPAPAATPVK